MSFQPRSMSVIPTSAVLTFAVVLVVDRRVFQLAAVRNSYCSDMCIFFVSLYNAFSQTKLIL